MDFCSICDHPPHAGRRCFAPITRNVSVPHNGVIFTRIDTLANCACGIVDEMAKIVDEECTGWMIPNDQLT